MVTDKGSIKVFDLLTKDKVPICGVRKLIAELTEGISFSLTLCVEGHIIN